MAVTAKDGSRHHSASRALLHDEMAQGHGRSSGVIQKKDSSDKGPGAMTHPAPTKTPIDEHVSEHGPAHTLNYHHDEVGDGMHHVSSYHGDAVAPAHHGGVGGQGGEAKDGMGGGEHEGGEHPGAHHSRHKTHHAAHQHMAKAMGTGHEEEDEETPDSDDQPGSDEGGASGIPGLS
jgi:hypothetical protein